MPDEICNECTMRRTLVEASVKWLNVINWGLGTTTNKLTNVTDTEINRGIDEDLLSYHFYT